MTVQELIDKLKTFPSHAEIIYQQYSDWSTLEPEEVKFISAEQSKRIQNMSESDRLERNRNYGYEGAICYRNGRYSDAYPLHLYSDGEVPVYRDVVTFPGN